MRFMRSPFSNEAKRAKMLLEGRLRRPAWWLPAQHVRVRMPTVSEREATILRRQLLMLRRSTLEHYFTAEQAAALVNLLHSAGHVEAMVSLFARVTDLERHHTHAQFARTIPLPHQHEEYVRRIGIANVFNPFLPDSDHINLNLRVAEERTVASMLVELSAETGENLGCDDTR